MLHSTGLEGGGKQPQRGDVGYGEMMRRLAGSSQKAATPPRLTDVGRWKIQPPTRAPPTPILVTATETHSVLRLLSHLPARAARAPIIITPKTPRVTTGEFVCLFFQVFISVLLISFFNIFVFGIFRCSSYSYYFKGYKGDWLWATFFYWCFVQWKLQDFDHAKVLKSLRERFLVGQKTLVGANLRGGQNHEF